MLAGLLLVQEAGGVPNDFLAGGGVSRRHPTFAAAATHTLFLSPLSNLFL